VIGRQSFEYIRDVAATHIGYRFDDGSEFLVESRLLPVARERNCGSVNELIRLMQRGVIEDVEQLLVEALADRETAFFRDFWPFEALRNQLLPELKTKRSAQQKLVVWSIGCSTGQEPYSVALLLHEYLPDLLKWNIQILASDISHQTLAIAKEARYNQIEANRGLPVSLLVKYFQKEGTNWRLKPEVSRLVTFAPINLMEPESWPEVREADLVLVRNVIGRFAKESQQDILRGILGRMNPESCLFLGAKETAAGIETDFEAIKFDKAVCFRPQASALAAQQQAAASAAGLGGSAQAQQNWSRLAKLAIRPGALNVRETRKILMADENLQKRVLTPTAQAMRAGRTQAKSLDDALPEISKDQLLAAAFCEPVMLAVNETFTAMLPTGLEAVPLDSVATDWSGQMVMGFRFSGAATGSVTIRFIPDFASKMAAPVLGLEAKDVEPEMAKQMVAQAGSLVSGRFQAVLREAGLECEVQDSEITQVNKFGLEVPSNAAHQPFAFRSEGQPILVDLVVSTGQRPKQP
jgi:chemotaxis protein methyltransferase CheR